MASSDSGETNFETNKTLVHDLAQRDGKLVSPIDLSLDQTKQLFLDRLRWMNLDDAPIKMKLTNTGETVIISAKWEKQRPYLSGGPLDGTYVFSQIHFHWGSNEHEGSEHTVKGVCYPMEMHVVFYKTRYLTQEAALKKDDGIIIVVYLIKLQSQSTEGLRWLSTQLAKVVEPQTSTVLPLSPLSALVVPFTRDYILYWGSLVTQRCSHTMLWLVSRAALAINVDDLNMFRKLLNSRKEAMNKNFRSTNPPEGRTVFHVNPSTETKHLLLPGTIEPPGQSLLVNFSQMPALDKLQASKIFNRGDTTDEESDKLSTCTPNSNKLNKVHSTSKTYIYCEGLDRGEIEKRANKSTRTFSNTKSISNESCSLKSGSSPRSCSPPMGKAKELHRTKSQKRRHAASRKRLERERRQELDKIKNKIFKKNEDSSIPNENMARKNKTSSGGNKGLLTARAGLCHNVSKRNETTSQKQTEEKPAQAKGAEIVTEGLCVHLETTHTVNKEKKIDDESMNTNTNNKRILEDAEEIPQKENETKKERVPFRSKLPVRSNNNKHMLQSSLAQYFSKDRPDSAPQTKTQTATPLSTEDHTVKNRIYRPKTTIPRPIGKNAGKIEDNLIEIKKNPLERSMNQPVSLLMKQIQQR